ncbi:pH-response regulator protein palH/prr-4 [Cladobotryum mycophilum]|uniref:PH-response regulator protein palH/prr-4 n=1 Tax=Cladobotryum mycophilum TaxID=491253 RepID=A0ABR0SAG7_9HYPO
MSDSLTTTFTSPLALCTTMMLPANGILSLDGKPDAILTLDNNAVFKAPCPTASIPSVSIVVSSPASSGQSSLSLSDSGDDDDSPHFSDFRDPFYASSFPICYALASTTVTAYMLVIMLFVTPRSFLDSGVVYLGRRGGFTNSSSGGVTIGGRPWLQKVAALTVAISLTIATADTFKIAKDQYIWGVQNAKVLQNQVMGSVELRAIRIISDTFLWLAQAQTLIRLFPRQREKIIIKWAAFALITLDVIFSALNSFLYTDPDTISSSMPKSFAHPIPALSYLFQLSLGVLYAAWVIYYALMKKRYAFYHPLMKNMCLVAIMSLTAIVIPVVFFILDISKPEFTGWGDYVRWVGAAAASVVVWEWVERIEALEREEKKDGILGREVFDGDDTLEVNASQHPWPRNRKGRKGGGHDTGGGGTSERQQESATSNAWSNIPVISSRHRDRDRDHGQHGDTRGTSAEHAERTMGNILRPAVWLTRPAPAVTPISRTDTASAESTVYAVRYQGGSDAMTRTPEPPLQLQNMSESSRQTNVLHSPYVAGDVPPSTQSPASVSQNGHVVGHTPSISIDLEANRTEPSEGRWQTLVQTANPLFNRGGETSSAQPLSDSPPTTNQQRTQTENRSRWDIRARLEEFAANQAEKIRERLQPTTDTDSLPVTVIPAPARRGAALQQVLEEEELGSSAASAIRRARRRSTSDSDESDDGVGASGRRNMAAGTTRSREGPIPPTSPPLWPGVRHRQMLYDDDDAYSYDDSITESLSVVSHDQGRELEPEPDDRRTAAGRPPGNS